VKKALHSNYEEEFTGLWKSSSASWSLKFFMKQFSVRGTDIAILKTINSLIKDIHEQIFK